MTHDKETTMTTESTTEAPMWHFTTPDGNTHDFDTTSDALSAVIEGYTDDLDRDTAFYVRLDHAHALAEELQARSLADAEVPAHVADVLTSDKSRPVEVETWTSDVPLYVVSTNYLPYAPQTAPTGNVRVLDPSDEYAFMESLFSCGYLSEPQG